MTITSSFLSPSSSPFWRPVSSSRWTSSMFSSFSPFENLRFFSQKDFCQKNIFLIQCDYPFRTFPELLQKKTFADYPFRTFLSYQFPLINFCSSLQTKRKCFTDSRKKTETERKKHKCAMLKKRGSLLVARFLRKLNHVLRPRQLV